MAKYQISQVVHLCLSIVGAQMPLMQFTFGELRLHHMFNSFLSIKQNAIFLSQVSKLVSRHSSATTLVYAELSPQLLDALLLNFVQAFA